MESFSDITQPENTQRKDEIYEMGKEFAFEGLDETCFKAQNEDELERFRKGFQEGLRTQQAALPQIEEEEKRFK